MNKRYERTAAYLKNVVALSADAGKLLLQTLLLNDETNTMTTDAKIQKEVNRFRRWADRYPVKNRNDWWAEEYPDWSEIDAAILEYVADVPPTSWSAEALENILYAIARDDERLSLVSALGRQSPNVICPLSAAALEQGEREAKWQLAVQLGRSDVLSTEAEELLVRLAGEADEYVRRRALMVLARHNSPYTEEIALVAWGETHEAQEWARMAALWSLHSVQSSHLEGLLIQAETDPRTYLSEYAKKMRRGEVEEISGDFWTEPQRA